MRSAKNRRKRGRPRSSVVDAETNARSAAGRAPRRPFLTTLRRFCAEYEHGVRPATRNRDIPPLGQVSADLFSVAPGRLPWGHGQCDPDESELHTVPPHGTPKNHSIVNGRRTGAASNAARGSAATATPPNTTKDNKKDDKKDTPRDDTTKAATAQPSEQASLAESFTRMSAQLLQQYVASHARRVLTSDDEDGGWGGRHGVVGSGSTDRFKCSSMSKSVDDSSCPCSREGCLNEATDHCFHCNADMCPGCDDSMHQHGAVLASPHLHERVTFRQGYEQMKHGSIDTRLVWPELPPVFQCPQADCTSRKYRRLPWQGDGGIVRVIDWSTSTCHHCVRNQELTVCLCALQRQHILFASAAFNASNARKSSAVLCGQLPSISIGTFRLQQPGLGT